jgi:hypothetical protein
VFMKKTVVLIALLVLSLALTSSNATADDPNGLPGDLPEFTISQNGETAPGFLVGSVSSTVEDVGSYFLILDNAGHPLFYSQTQSLGGLECSGLFSSRTEIKGLQKKYTWYLQNADFDEVDTLQMGNGYLADNHAFELLPNGHALMLAYDEQTIDMSEIVEGGHPAATVAGAVIQELDANRQVIFQWRTWDHIPITDSYRDITVKKFGYIHVNGVSLDPVDGNIIVCCRETSEVVKVSRVTGELMWRMGGKQNEFTFLNEHEENAPRYFKLMHDARRLANGNLTLFDNGADQAVGDQERTYSRAVEYALDEENKTATLVWEYRNDPDIRALTGGSVTRLPGGHTVINWGDAAKAGEAPAMTEADPNGQLVYDISCAQEGVTGGFSRIVWPLAEQATTVTRYELMEGNTYTFDNNDAKTGVALKVDTLDGEGYNELYVTREPFAPLFPEFPGKAPRVLPVRVTVAARDIAGMTATLSFDAKSFGFADRSGVFGYADPNALTVYYRAIVGRGLFLPLATNYNFVTRQLRATMPQLGEFILGFPDLEEVPYAPLLIQPEDGSTVNQQLPVSFFWTPRGFGRTYDLQVSRSPDFAVLDVDEIDLTETRYALASIEPGATYYWRVRTINDGGVGDWSTRSFATVAPGIEITSPNGGEHWQKGLPVFIRWQDNLDEDLVIELYKGDTLVRTMKKIPSVGAYEWEVALDLEPGDDYTLRIKSAADETIWDRSDAAFSIE